MPLVANWTYPTTVRVGPGRLAELPEACRAAGIARPLIVTDPGLSKLPMIARARDICAAAGLPAAVFDQVQPNPIDRNVEAGVAAFRAGGHDGVIAIGGGSALDCGKVIAFAVGQTRPLWDFEDIGDWWTRANPAGIAPVIAIPTTAGTGSETGRAGVITNSETHTKKVIFHPLMMPKIVISDPELSVGLPPSVTAGTGMDALSHCLEAYCAPGYHPLADGIAVEGARLVHANLRTAVKTGTDLDARTNMLAAASMGSTAFQKGLGAMHALSHPIGARQNTHHGMTNAVFMPYVLAFNRPAIEARIARLAAYCGLAPSFDAYLAEILKLRADVGVPHTLKEFGVSLTDLDTLAEMAIVDPTAGGNPVPLTKEAAIDLYHRANEGRV
jgi:alcohol dehydrogenase class IV